MIKFAFRKDTGCNMEVRVGEARNWNLVASLG